MHTCIQGVSIKKHHNAGSCIQACLPPPSLLLGASLDELGESLDVTRISFHISNMPQISSSEILSQLKSWNRLANPDGHNAAVVLATPDHARRIVDDGFMSDLANALAGEDSHGEFHVLGAAIDHIAPPVGSYQPFSGMSILRGNLDHILPQLWQDSPSKSRRDADTPSALEFEIGKSRVTVPGANTAFQNARDFTLTASHFDLSKGKNRILRQLDKTQQRIVTPVSRNVESLADLGLWAPLLPVTRARAVTASFGNIIKGVEVDGESTPASTELEEAVEKAFKEIPDLAESGPIGIWALVVPKDLYAKVGAQLGPDSSLESHHIVEDTAQQIEMLHSRGAKLYQIRKLLHPSLIACFANVITVSGGGGWGAKKGLLSLDPQQTHFALSEEESLDRFMGSMEASDFAPIGSYIQFLTPLKASSDSLDEGSSVEGIVFGVHDSSLASRDGQEFRIHDGLFGALSNKGIFISDATAAESKLSVPNSRVFYLKNNSGASGWSKKHESDPMLTHLPLFWPGGGFGAGTGASEAAGAGAAAGEAESGGILEGIDMDIL